MFKITILWPVTNANVFFVDVYFVFVVIYSLFLCQGNKEIAL